MVSVDLSRTERAALADTFTALGPSRPTLCEGWDTGDLLAHLLVRERRPDAAVGVVLPLAAGWTRKVMDGTREHGWAEQIETFRSGPPGWNPMSWGALDRLANSLEMFVHHEDALRGGEDWSARDLEPATHRAVVDLLRSPMVKAGFKAADGGVVVRVTDGAAEQVIAVKPGPDVVEITGGVADVVLWAVGRRHVAVEFTGPDAAVAALTGSSRQR